MKLRKTKSGKYTLKEVDEKGEKTEEAHYKFVRLRDVSDKKSD